MIGDKLNYDDDFLRALTVSVLDTLEGEIYWEYRFSSGTRKVVVPFYYSYTGDEKFAIDTFVDDVVSNNRLTELNTDIIPRGVLTMTGFDMLTDQLANPNVWVRVPIEDKGEMKNILARIRPIPIAAKYELGIVLNSENDYFKCSEALMNTIGVYRYLAFQYNNFNINAVIQMPDTNQFEITRDANLTSKNQIKLTTTFEVISVYPGWRRPGTSGIRANGDSPDGNCPPGWIDSYTYDPYKNTDANNIIIPKRTKWYSNIYKATGNSADNGTIDSTNPNGV